jgi:nitrite reductase (NADH) large subunit
VPWPLPTRIVVIGLSMVGWRFCERLLQLDKDGAFELVSFCEEKYPAYNRVGLSQMFANPDHEELYMSPVEWYDEGGIKVLLGHKVPACPTALPALW